MSREAIPLWVQEAVKSASRPEDWHALGERYQSSLENSSPGKGPEHPRFVERKIRGVYYTPEPLAERLADATLGPILADARQEILRHRGDDEALRRITDQVKTIRVLDPACGTGAFLVKACERLWHFYHWLNGEMQRRAVDPAMALDQVVGVEIDTAAVEICRYRLAGIASIWGLKGWSPDVICADALRCDQLPPANVVLTNPPFEVLTNFTSRPRAAETAQWVRWSGRFPLSSRGQINLYRLFLERCLQHLPLGGSLGIIVPLGFIGDRQGARLRECLMTSNRLESVTLISEHSRAFSAVAQGVALLVARKGEATQSVMVEYDGSGTRNGVRRSRVSTRLISAISSGLWVIPHCHPKLIPVLERMNRCPTLAGTKGGPPVAVVYVGELDQTIHRSYICDQPTGIMLLRGEHMGGRYFLNLSKSGPARFVDPAFIEAGVISRQKRPHIERERLVFQGIANLGLPRRLRFALCPAGVVLGNSVNYLALSETELQHIDYYLGLLNSRLLNWRFRVTSYGHNVSNYEVNSLPIVPYADAGPDAQEIARMAQRLSRLVQGGQGQTPEAMELDQRIDRLIYRVYGITEAEQELIESEEQTGRRAHAGEGQGQSVVQLYGSGAG